MDVGTSPTTLTASQHIEGERLGAAEELFASITTVDHVTALAKERVESLHLDFKERRGFTGKLCSDKNDLAATIAKALSGFANSDGGVLVLGIEDKTRELCPIDELRAFEESIQEQLSRLVSFPIAGCLVKAVYTDVAANKGLLLVLIPASDAAPHRSTKDREYYFRVGESFLPMQHWQIADAFGRRHHPQLRAQLRVVGRPKDDVSGVMLILGVENYGRAIAKFPMLQIVKGPRQHIQDATVRRSTEIPTGLPLANGMVNEQIYSGGAQHVVHAGQALDVVMYEAHCSNNFTWLDNKARTAISIEVVVAAEGAPARSSTVDLTFAMLDDAHDDRKSFIIHGS